MYEDALYVNIIYDYTKEIIFFCSINKWIFA